ncbi:MAG TPA: hypothetical protein VNU97_15660 [Rhizomicrobium sp.]|jgi:hypothetical protein|nr:hypothetical protein [Rhizomicrobium sp.]
MTALAYFRYVIIGSVTAVLGLSGAIPFLIWGSNGAPEFYGAFTAAIVAAVAVVIGTQYQAELTRKRDDALRSEDRVAEAIDLCLWLEHAADELDFVAGILERAIERLALDGKSQIEMPLEQFRQVISPKFVDDLLIRAKMATRLPPGLAGQVARTLYKTFHVADRALLLRGASELYRPNKEQVEKYLFVLRRRAGLIRRAAENVEIHLVTIGAMTLDITAEAEPTPA